MVQTGKDVRSPFYQERLNHFSNKTFRLLWINLQIIHLSGMEVNPKSDIASTAHQMKYHPLIMEKTFLRNLLKVSNEISVEQKHLFLQNFSESLKEILTCINCGGIQQENSLAFSCGHHFCETCSKNLNFCSKCENEGYKCGFTVKQNYSALLSIIGTLQTNFNVERVFFEMLKFFLTPPHLLNQQDPAIFTANITKNSAPISQECPKSSKKFTATSKRFKTLINKENNFKKKLEFSQNVSSRSHTIENDSEGLFIDLTKRDPPLDNVSKVDNQISYLDQQPSIDESRNSPVVKSPANHRKAAKRKFSKNTPDDAADKRLKTRKTTNGLPEVVISVQKLRSPLKLTKRRISRDSTSSSPSSASPNLQSKNAEGTFLGFNDAQISDSYYRLQTAVKCFEYLKSMEGQVANMSPVFPRPPSSNSVDLLCRTGCTSVEKVKVTSRAKKSKSNVQAEKKLENEPVQVQPQKLQESSNRIKESKQEPMKVQGKEKENNVLSLPDPEMEAIDPNVWQHNEKVSRKKKALMFKSVKERNRRSLLLDGVGKLSTDEHKNSVLQEPVLITQTEKNQDPQTDQVGQVVIDTCAEKSEVPPAGNSGDPSDCKEDVVLTNIVSDLCKNSSSDMIQKEDEPSTVSQSPCKSNVELRKIEEQHEVSQILWPDEVNVMKSSLISNPQFKILLSKIDDSKLEAESCFSTENKTSPPAVETKEALASETENINLESHTVDVQEILSVAGTDDIQEKLSASICSETSYKVETNTNIPAHPLVASDERSSPSVELIEKSSQPTIDTISDTVANSDESHPQEIVISSQPSGDPKLSAYEMHQPATSELNGIIPTDAAPLDEDESIEKDHLLASHIQTRVKCAKLKKAINDQNEKLLDNIRTSFSLISPQALSVKRYRTPKSSGSSVHDADSPTSRVSFVKLDKDSPKKAIQSPEKLRIIHIKSPQKSVPYSLKSGCPTEEVLTAPASPLTRSVHCQTTSDLHVALLAQEFPHLFQQHGYSVYDTPGQSTLAGSKALDTLKTPNICNALPLRTTFTAVSSVTSSEKKIFENLFADRSVLGDSFRCPSTAERTGADISIQPLPSTGKKEPAEKRLLSVRLNFEAEQLPEEHSICAATSTPLCRSEAIFSSSVADEAELESGGSGVKRETTGSDEAELVDSSLPGGSAAAVAEVGVEQNRSSDLIADSDAILNASSMVLLTHGTASKAGAGRLESAKDNAAVIDELEGCTPNPEDFDIDDDDVEFIAGTPTSYSKRRVDDNLEKLMTQSFSLKNQYCGDVSRNEKTDQILFDSAGSRSQMSESLIESSRPPPSVARHKLPSAEATENSFSARPLTNSVSFVGVPKDSLDLFNSTAANSAEATSLVLAISGLKDADVSLVKLFCQRFSVSLVDRVTQKTTHLVVKTDRKNRTARTFKYLQAIVNNIRVVSVEWVRACVDAKETLDEEKFVPFDSSGESGPLRAYNLRKGVTPSPLSWLRDYCIFFTEPVPPACTLVQLQEIVQKTGAVVICSLKDFKKYPNLHHLIIVSDEEESSQTSNSDIANWLKTYQAVAIEFNWLLEVIGRNRLVPFAEYELVEIPSNMLLKLNFPASMLQYEKEDVQDSD